MKRIILILLIMFNINVFAYELYEKEILTYYEETETLKREEVTLYNNYYIDVVNKGYQSKEDVKEGYIIDYDDYILEETKNNDLNKMNNYNYSSLNTRNIRIQYIRLFDFTDDVILKDMKIYNNEELVKYTKRLDRGDFNEKLNSSSSIFFFLEKPCMLNDVKIVLTLSKTKNNVIINSSYGIGLYQHPIYKILKISNSSEDVIYEITHDNDNDNHYYITEEKLYNTSIKQKVYSDIYTTKPLNGHELDYEDLKTGYNYYKKKDEMKNKDNIKEEAITKKEKTSNSSIKLKKLFKVIALLFTLIIEYTIKKIFKKRWKKEISNYFIVWQHGILWYNVLVLGKRCIHIHLIYNK